MTRRAGKPTSRLRREDWRRIRSLVSEDWSPEQISLWLSENSDIRVSHEWIYQHVYQDKADGGAATVPVEQEADEVKIAVVLRPGAEFDPADLIESLVPRMPRFAIPRYVEIWDALPKTEATARIKRRRTFAA